MSKRSQGAWGVVVSVSMFVVSALVLFAMDAAPRAAVPKSPQQHTERLAGEREIDGVACVTRAWFRADGRLESCTLARATTFANGLSLPAGARVGFDEAMSPEVVFLPADTEFDGHLCAGTGSDAAMTKFHPNGRLKFCNLARVETIDGVSCQRSSFWAWVTQGGSGTYFHDNGALQECLLAVDATVDGRVVKAKQHVRFDRDRRVLD